MTCKTAIVVCWGISLAVIPGCSSQKTGTVDGIISVDGQPTGGLEVAFRNDTDGSMALGATQADGKYSLRMGRGRSEISIGSYHVTVTPSAHVTGIPKPSVKLSEKYLMHDKTDLVQTVEPGENHLDIPLNSEAR